VAIAAIVGGNILVPLGQYTAGRWVRTWPGPDEHVARKFGRVEDPPRSWYPGGLPSEWFLWTEDLHGVPLRVGAPTLAEAHCQTVWGLLTRLQPFGHETTAIATSVQSGVQPFETSTLQLADDPGLWASLKAASERSEIAAIRSTRKDAEVVLSRRRPDWDPIYRINCVGTGKDDDELCSFETSRRLGTQPAEAGCDEVAVVQGWYARSPAAFSPLRASATLTDCDAKELRSSIPLALIAADGRTFVVVREHGYEDESFAVFELRGNRLEQVLEVPGGGC
jgi:hypothetical protein